MRDDDGHLTLHKLIKHLHGLTGLVLCWQTNRSDPYSETHLTASRNSNTCKNVYLICHDEMFQSDNQTWDDGTHLVLQGNKKNWMTKYIKLCIWLRSKEKLSYYLFWASICCYGSEGEDAVVQSCWVAVVLQHRTKQLQQLAIVRFERLRVRIHHLIQQQQSNLLRHIYYDI